MYYTMLQVYSNKHIHALNTQNVYTANPGVAASGGQAAGQTGQGGNEVVEPTHFPKHRLLLRVQLEHTQHRLQDLCLDDHRHLG